MPELNTAFKQSVNTTFNNSLFSAGTIPVMHPSATRLYEVARSLDPPVVGQSAVARWLNESPQAIKNWETRGVSKSGAMKAQRLSGCDSNWLLTGGGEQGELLGVQTSTEADYAQLLADLEVLAPSLRSKFLDQIHQAAEVARETLEHNRKPRHPVVAHAARVSSHSVAQTHAVYGDGNERQGVLTLSTVRDPFTAQPDAAEERLYRTIRKAKK